MLANLGFHLWGDLRRKSQLNFKRLGTWLLLAALPLNAWAQKVKVGYDKGADFGKFKTYSWAAPAMPVTRPMLYDSVIGSVDAELKAKGLTRVDGEGDLILVPASGMEMSVNVAVGTPILPTYAGPPPTIDATMWMGATGPSNLMAPYVPEGTLVLTYVDRVANKEIWTGSVKEKLDLQNKMKSLERVQKAIAKLLKEFPPKSRN